VGIKTHDYHNLLHDILPIIVCSTLTENIWKIVYRLGALFKWACSKEIAIKDISQKKFEAVEILCEVTVHLPPPLFTSQFHLIFHLIEEIEMCGLVATRWIYWAEHYMKDLKSFVRLRASPKGSMVEGHLCAEAFYYISEYTMRLHKIAPSLRKLVGEDSQMMGIVLPETKSTQ
jgi:hypothetical protein